MQEWENRPPQICETPGTVAQTLCYIDAWLKKMRDAFKSRKHFADFTKKKAKQTKSGIRTFMHEFIETASDHTIATIAPPEDDILGSNLTDEQVIHLLDDRTW